MAGGSIRLPAPILAAKSSPLPSIAILDVDDVGGVGGVRGQQLLQDLDLALGLLQEPLLVPDYLERGVLLGLVVIYLELVFNNFDNFTLKNLPKHHKSS